MYSRFLICAFSLLFFSYLCSAKTPAASPLELDLDEAIELALTNNEGMLVADNSVENAGQRIREAWADVLPNISFSGLYTRNFKQPVFYFPDPLTGRQTAFRIGSCSFQARFGKGSPFPLVGQQLFAGEAPRLAYGTDEAAFAAATRYEKQGTEAYLHCYEKEAEKQPFFFMLAKQAQSIVSRLTES